MTAARDAVAALYVDPRGPYPRMDGVDCWDEARDARLYAGPLSVVAHPPCGAWGSLRKLWRGGGKECGVHSVASVRCFGGVLEQPAHSLLWKHCRLPQPGELPDEYGGWSLEVDQVSWGHVARKRTWLYLVGVPQHAVTPRTGGTPTHWCSGTVTPGRRGSAPEGVKIASAEQRRITPPAFADWLVSLARTARGTAEAK